MTCEAILEQIEVVCPYETGYKQSSCEYARVVDGDDKICLRCAEWSPVFRSRKRSRRRRKSEPAPCELLILVTQRVSWSLLGDPTWSFVFQLQDNLGFGS